MKTKTKVLIALGAVVLVILVVVAIYWETHIGNRQLMDVSYRFDYAIIGLPNGETVEGKVTSWLDFSDSDAVQVTIDGKTYLTHYSNVCLISD